MQFGVQIGCGLFAFSPFVGLSLMIVSKRPVLIVFAIFAAGIWLLSFVLTSFVWSILSVILQNYLSLASIIGVFSQEAARALIVYSYDWFNQCVVKRTKPSESSSHSSTSLIKLDQSTSSVAIGVGFGGMHLFVLYGSLWMSSLSKATLFVDSCPHLPLIFVSGVFAVVFFLLDVLFMVAVFRADLMDKQQQVWTLVICCHLVATFCTLLNQPFGCRVSLPLISIALGVSMWILKRITR